MLAMCKPTTIPVTTAAVLIPMLAQLGLLVTEYDVFLDRRALARVEMCEATRSC
jgi:hypothetical protein